MIKINIKRFLNDHYSMETSMLGDKIIDNTLVSILDKELTKKQIIGDIIYGGRDLNLQEILSLIVTIIQVYGFIEKKIQTKKERPSIRAIRDESDELLELSEEEIQKIYDDIDSKNDSKQ